MRRFVVKTIRQARRVIVAVVGFTVVALGAAMLLTPGPGGLLIFLGLSLLAAEFVWARLLLRRIKRKGSEISGAIFGTGKAGPGGDATPPADAPRIAP